MEVTFRKPRNSELENPTITTSWPMKYACCFPRSKITRIHECRRIPIAKSSKHVEIQIGPIKAELFLYAYAIAAAATATMNITKDSRRSENLIPLK